jgi:hypothetical protein
VTSSSSSPQPTPTPGGQPDASPKVQQAAGLYDSAQAAVNSIRDDYFYWTGKLTESSFVLSLAVIGANWAVFGSVDKVLNNICAEISIALVILNLVISLIGNGLLGRWLLQRIDYAEKDPTRWQKEFNENAGRSKHWPSTQMIDDWAGYFRIAKIFLPVIGGAFFLIALFTQPKTEKVQSPSGPSAPATPAALLSPSATASPSKSAALGEIQAKPVPERESDDAVSAKKSDNG